MKNKILAAVFSVASFAVAPLVSHADATAVEKWFFENEYGVRPLSTENADVSFTEVIPPKEVYDSRATYHKVRVDYSGPLSKGSFFFHAIIPKSQQPVPVTLLMCNRPGVMPIDVEKDADSPFWPKKTIVERGYAAIAYYLSDLASETYVPKTALASGVFKAFGPRVEERKDNDWGVLSAWAWGASRVMDWISSNGALDAKKVMVIGHSRGGKSSLVAGISDKRFAMVVSNNSGRGGSCLNKMALPLSEPWRSFGYFGVSYWFCKNYTKTFCNGRDQEALYDQDDWLSLVLPRILVVGSAQADSWAGPEGEFAATQSAAEKWWKAGVPENIHYTIREGGHGLRPVDWKKYIDIADARWRGKTVRVEGSDCAAIQKCLDAEGIPLTVIVPEGDYNIRKTLRVRSGTIIKAHSRARFKLDGSVKRKAGDFLLANADEENGNSDITIEGGIWDGNKEVGYNVKVPQEEKFNPSSWSGVTLNFRNVKNLRLYDMTLANSVTFNARFCQVDGFDIRRIKIVSPLIKNNQDGFHFGGYTFNGVIDGVQVETKGQTNDDLIALNADDSITRHENRGTINGPITNIVIRNVYAEDCHCFLRLLRAYNDIRDITVEKCTVGCRYNVINGDDAKKWIAHGGEKGGVKEASLPSSTGALANILIRDVKFFSSVKNGFPLVKIDGKLEGRGVEFDGFERDMAKDVDPLRPLASDERTLQIIGADAMPPPPKWNEGAPHFNGPKVFGATPGRFFHFIFPVRGSREGLRFSISKGAVPDGVALDASSGILSGRAKEGEWSFTVKATNAEGSALRDFKLIVGPGRLMLTPQLGWDSWNAYANDVSDEIVRKEARAMIDTGLASRGYASINIDAGWQGKRDGYYPEALLANSKFPNMEKLFKDLHAMGLRVGLYSSPMIFTWGSATSVHYQGSTTFPVDWEESGHYYPIGKTHKEAADAALWAKWGVDYIKYDWGNATRPKFAKRMREALDATGRDVYLSVCTDCRVEDAAEHAKYAQIVRAGNRDLIDEWKGKGEKPNGVVDVMPFQKPWISHIRPGFWYDLDMMSLGPMYLGKHGNILNERLIGNNLTHNEAAFHFIYWAFCCNPIHLSCRMGQLDKFTLDLISNEEIIAIMMDYPAQAPRFESYDNGIVVGTRKLSDGRTVKAYFNFSDELREIDGYYLPPHFARLKTDSF